MLQISPLLTSVQISVCSPSQLDCVEKVRVDTAECLDHCRGTIMDFERRESAEVDKEGLEQFIEDYENYKDPHNMNSWYADERKGI